MKEVKTEVMMVEKNKHDGMALGSRILQTCCRITGRGEQAAYNKFKVCILWILMPLIKTRHPEGREDDKSVSGALRWLYI